MTEAEVITRGPTGVRASDAGYGRPAREDRSRRDREAALRSQINRLVGQRESTRRTLQDCTDAIVTNLNVVFARIWTLDRRHRLLKLQASSGLYTGLDDAYARIPVGHCKIGQIAESRFPCLTNFALGDPGLDQDFVKQEEIVAFAGSPLVVDDRVIGVLAVFARHAILPETLDTIGSIGVIVAQGIERQRTHRSLQRAIKANYEAVLRERTRIAREMHDGLLQDVTGIALQLRAVLPRLRSAPESSATDLEHILELAERTSTEARLAVVDMRHFSENDDPVKAVQDAAERTLAGSALAFSLNIRGTTRTMSPRVCDAATLIVQHALRNVLRHAQAQSVRVAMGFGIRGLRISVRDDGCGFLPHPSSNGTHFGLLGMQERAREIGAKMRVRSALEQGTTVSVLVPYKDSTFGE